MRRTFTRVFALITAVAGTSIAASAIAAGTEALWSDSASRALEVRAPHPARLRTLTLNLPAMQGFLDDNARRGDTLALPRPAGGYSEFVLRDSGAMPPELAARFPEIRSYVGLDADGNQARIDVSPLGFHAMVFDRNGIWIVQPQAVGVGPDYMSFARAEAGASGSPFVCGVHGKTDANHFDLPRAAVEPQVTTGTIKRNYRTAIAANHNYVIAVSPVGGATVATGLAAITLAVNRVNQVYENDLAVHLTLIANNNLIVYPAATGDPYPNDETAIEVNTGNINTVIGNANYDVGHVFTTGSGGVAGLGVVCDSSFKGDGTTGLSNPIGDVFYIDYVAHEMGHQFGANHTFNGTGDFCNGNRNSTTAYEPGSGSTVMAYAGICGASNDLQSNSDPYFHAASLNEIKTYTTTPETGATCGTATANANAVPTIAPLSNFIIPSRTPFQLTGSATTSSGGTLSYAWEQFDLGATNNNLAIDPGTGPITRSFTPGGAVRTIPRLTDLIASTSSFGNILPTTNRTLHFRLTVRDNVALAGTSNSADMTVQSVATAGPFAVTAPGTPVTWTGGTIQSVTWNVSSTTAPPISCSQIGLDLSQDGGATYPQPLGTYPNTGSATIVVPNVSTTQARIRASCVGNIFFNISAPNFTINPGVDLIFANGFQ